MQRSKAPLFFLGLSAVIALSALALLFFRPGVKTKQTAAASAMESPIEAPQVTKAPDASAALPEDTPLTLDTLAPALGASDPAQLMAEIGKAFEMGDISKVARLIGKDAFSPESLAQLQALAGKPIRFQALNGIREVGELELNQRSRWILTLDGSGGESRQILLDLRKVADKWSVDHFSFLPRPSDPVPQVHTPDSLEVADAFLQAVLKQNFELANTLVDPKTVSDAKIAGLCILFEEGGYQLRKSKPLRAMFNRQDTTGYLANLETTNASQAAQFAITLQQAPAPSAKWIVTEINLDQLLADYASRIAGGDIYYTPLVKNPAGGDTLALYFEFNEDVMNPRTRRQLEIVTLILKSDPGKKITLSGHADSLGTKDYNNHLSARRADVVRDFLIKAGVSTTQIVTLAKGDSQPRRPNLTEAGADNPEGRRANRRTEIYLDF